jgi:large subunit ribosomal protein L25
VERLDLNANPRNLLGKKVKSLRSAGQIPANIYGKGVASTAVDVAEKKFQEVLHEAGETGVIYIKVSSEESARPVLVHGVQRHPVSDRTLHVDFYQVNLKEKTTANVPIVVEGENELEKRGEGLIIQTRSEVPVEALPTDIPHQFVIDVGGLTEIGQSVKVGDLDYDHDKVEVQADPDENILVMQPAEMKEEVVEEVETEVIGEVKEGEEAEEGEVGEARAEEPPA